MGAPGIKAYCFYDVKLRKLSPCTYLAKATPVIIPNRWGMTWDGDGGKTVVRDADTGRVIAREV